MSECVYAIVQYGARVCVFVSGCATCASVCLSVCVCGGGVCLCVCV